MNRRLRDLIKALLFSLPLAAPGVARAQSAGTSSDTGAQQQQGATGSMGSDTSTPTSDQMKDQEKEKQKPAHHKGRKGKSTTEPPSGAQPMDQTTKPMDQTTKPMDQTNKPMEQNPSPSK